MILTQGYTEYCVQMASLKKKNYTLLIITYKYMQYIQHLYMYVCVYTHKVVSRFIKVIWEMAV